MSRTQAKKNEEAKTACEQTGRRASESASIVMVRHSPCTVRRILFVDNHSIVHHSVVQASKRLHWTILISRESIAAHNSLDPFREQFTSSILHALDRANSAADRFEHKTMSDANEQHVNGSEHPINCPNGTNGHKRSFSEVEVEVEHEGEVVNGDGIENGGEVELENVGDGENGGKAVQSNV